MKALFNSQDLTDIVENGIEIPKEGVLEAQKTAVYKELKKKDCKALIILHQCIDDSHFEKIDGAVLAKEA